MSKSRLLGAICAVFLTASPFSPAHAITVLLEFQATFDGAGIIRGDTPPQSIVSGEFIYTAVDLISAIDTLVDVDLTINSYSYGVDDFTTDSGFQLCIGELISGACTTSGAVRDFTIEWVPNPTTPSDPVPVQVAYSIGSRDVWAVGREFPDTNGSIDILSLTEITAIPVPPAVWLFGSGLLGLIGISRRKKAA